MDGKNDKQIRIRVSADLLERWNALHKAQATNGSEVIRRGMEQYIQSHTQHGDDIPPVLTGTKE